MQTLESLVTIICATVCGAIVPLFFAWAMFAGE